MTDMDSDIQKKSKVPVVNSRNKARRKALFIIKKRYDNRERHKLRAARKKAEKLDPSLRTERLARNKPITIDAKRKWDDVEDFSLGASVDVAKLQQKQLERQLQETKETALANFVQGLKQLGNQDNDVDMATEKGEEAPEKEQDFQEGNSIFDSESESEQDEDEDTLQQNVEKKLDNDASSLSAWRKNTPPSVSGSQTASIAPSASSSLAHSTTSTHLDLHPTALALKFPMLFQDGVRPPPKILVTTSLQATIHKEAQLIASLFPNSTYIRRSAHRFSHNYSVREIARFAHNREYTTLAVVHETQKVPTALTLVNLPDGPTFTFTIANWVEGRSISGHGRPTDHYPELLLNNFRTPLGLLTARMFLTLFPQIPEFPGRQVVTLHNQRDYIFVRRHRYVFREAEGLEKSVQGADGKDLRGVEGIRAGLQELGPRFTMKLRRIDKGVGRAGSSGEDATSWEWKGGLDKDRTRFSL